MYLYVKRRSIYICRCVVNTGEKKTVPGNKKMVRTGRLRPQSRCVVNTGGGIKADLIKPENSGYILFFLRSRGDS